MNGSTSRMLRWGAPVAAAAAVAVVASGVLSAEANPPLPPRTAAQLLADVQGARIDGLSGTVLQTSDLGLPELPTGGPGAKAGSSLTSLLTGSHTMRIWMAGDTKQRLALISSLGESDLVRNGRDVWLWSSEERSATHYTLPADAAKSRPDDVQLPSGVTPQEAAEKALAAIDPTTAVTTDGTGQVAGRDAYELVLAPKDTRSLVGQVRIAVDSQTSLPLRVQVFGKASSDGPAISIGFQKVSFAVPGDDQFSFRPPAGTQVTEGTLPAGTGRPGPGTGKHPDLATGQAVKVVGKGWTSVLVADGMRPEADGGGAAGALLDQMQAVSGSWGSGRLLTTRLVSVLLVDDGRVLIGAVPPELLYQAAT